MLFYADSSIGIAGVQARSILESVYGYHFVHCPAFSDTTASYKTGGRISVNSIADVYGVYIEARPNPASQWTTLYYSLPDSFSDGTIIIRNTNGTVIKRIHVNGKQGQKLLDTRKFAPGIYLYTLKTGGISKSGKMVITK